MSNRSDEELLAGIGRGDREAGREFFLRYRQGAYRLAYRFLGNEADALDVAEDAFVKVLTAAGSFRGESSAKTWFYRVVTNTALDARRKRARFVALEAVENEEGAGVKDLLPSREETPEAAAVRGETGEKIQRAIEGLSDKHRAVFCLVVLEGLSYGEAAVALGIAAGTVMSRLFYARKYLQKDLGEYVGADNE